LPSTELRYAGCGAHTRSRWASRIARGMREARGKDVGVIATETGGNLKSAARRDDTQHAQLIAIDSTDDTCALDRRFMMSTIRTRRTGLQPHRAWVGGLEGGLDQLAGCRCNDSLGLAAELKRRSPDKSRAACEWKCVIEDPERVAGSGAFSNAPDVAGPHSRGSPPGRAARSDRHAEIRG